MRIERSLIGIAGQNLIAVTVFFKLFTNDKCTLVINEFMLFVALLNTSIIAAYHMCIRIIGFTGISDDNFTRFVTRLHIRKPVISFDAGIRARFAGLTDLT
jgi:hypothetical protein